MTAIRAFSVDEFLRLFPARRGHFAFPSGIHGDLWLDLDALFVDLDALHPAVVALTARLESYELGAICGPVSGGAFLSLMVARFLDPPFFWTEPSLYDAGPSAYRLPRSLHERVSGKRVAIVDDAINAGSAVRETWDALADSGATVVAVGSLILLGTSFDGRTERGAAPVERLIWLPAGQWPSDRCVLCAAGTPLDNSADNAEHGSAGLGVSGGLE